MNSDQDEIAPRAASAAFDQRRRPMPTKDWAEMLQAGQRRHDAIVGDLAKTKVAQWKGGQR